MLKDLCFVDVTFFHLLCFAVALEMNYLRVYGTCLYQIFRIGTHEWA